MNEFCTWIFWKILGMLHLSLCVRWWDRTAWASLPSPFSLFLHRQVVTYKRNMPSVQVQHFEAWWRRSMKPPVYFLHILGKCFRFVCTTQVPSLPEMASHENRHPCELLFCFVSTAIIVVEYYMGFGIYLVFQDEKFSIQDYACRCHVLFLILWGFMF